MSSVLKKIKNWFYRIVYAIPFGMKGGEVLSVSNKDLDSSDSGIERYVVDERVSDALLRGEVTKEVAELRYRDYKVAEESRSYAYLGDGEGKKLKGERGFFGKIKMSVLNKPIYSNVSEELERVDNNEYLEERYTLNMAYGEETPQFKLESFCTDFEVKLGYKNGHRITLHFSNEPYFRKPITKAFVNYVRRIVSDTRNNGEFDNVKEMSFVTLGIEAEKNYVLYTFKDLECVSVDEQGSFFEVIYKIGNFEREDLTEKFKVEDLEKKYQEKKPKEIKESIVDFGNEKRFCSKCGKEITLIESFTQTDVYGECYCKKCFREIFPEQADYSKLPESFGEDLKNENNGYILNRTKIKNNGENRNRVEWYYKEP